MVWAREAVDLIRAGGRTPSRHQVARVQGIELDSQCWSGLVFPLRPRRAEATRP